MPVCSIMGVAFWYMLLLLLLFIFDITLSIYTDMHSQLYRPFVYLLPYIFIYMLLSTYLSYIYIYQIPRSFLWYADTKVYITISLDIVSSKSFFYF